MMLNTESPARVRTLPTTTPDSLDLWLAEQEDRDWAFYLEATYVDPAERTLY